MRKGTLNKVQGRIAIAATLTLIAGICYATSTSGVQVTAGNVQVSMDIKPDHGLSVRFDKPARG